MLKNAYLLAKISADTAENEQHLAEILPKTGIYRTGPPGRRRQLPERQLPARGLGLERLGDHANLPFRVERTDSL